MHFINVADLTDPNDPEGRSYRVVNNAKRHVYGVGDLVEVRGESAFITELTRDCDGTPLYSISMSGFCDESLKLICHKKDL